MAIVVYQIKDTIFWKQITTCFADSFKYELLFIRSKIQFFESKSQLKNSFSVIFKVVYQIKDTIFWKQITTNLRVANLLFRCLSDQRYNFLKANHNREFFEKKGLEVVYQIKDTIFWKQITTGSSLKRKDWKLFIRSKIQFFESKSQLRGIQRTH